MVKQLLENHYDELVNWARSCLKATYKQDAEDIVADSVINMLSRDVQLVPETALTFMKQEIKDDCLNHMAVQDNRKDIVMNNFENISTGLGLDDQVSDDPLDILVAEEDMRDRLNGLSPLLRDTLEAVVVEGRTPEEVAEAQGVKANVIYQRVHQARQLLQGNNK